MIERRKKIEDILLEMGIPVSIKGFRYIADAVEILMDNINISMTKVLYIDVAHQNKTTSSRVERAIRHAFEIERSNRGNFEVVEHYIGFMNCTNSASLCSLALKINWELQETKETASGSIPEMEIRRIVREELKKVIGENL